MHLSRDSSILTLASLRDVTKQIGNEVLCIFFKYITTHYFLINSNQFQVNNAIEDIKQKEMHE